MGKLHTLKRAIMRNPEIWMDRKNTHGRPVHSAVFSDGQWKPYTSHLDRVISSPRKNRDPYRPYRRYVKTILVNLGYDAVGDW